jgi:hypothetical protein
VTTQLAEEKNLWVGPVVVGNEGDRLVVRQGYDCSPRVQGHSIGQRRKAASEVLPATTVTQWDLSPFIYLGLVPPFGHGQLQTETVDDFSQSEANCADAKTLEPEAS